MLRTVKLQGLRTTLSVAFRKLEVSDFLKIDRLMVDVGRLKESVGGAVAK